MKMARSIAAVAFLALAISACGSQSPPRPTPPSQLFGEATRALETLQSNEVEGTFMIDQMGGTVHASYLQNGDVTGALSLGGESSLFEVFNHTTYFANPASFVTTQLAGQANLARQVKGQNWFRTPGSPPVAAIVQLASSEGITMTFLAGRDHLAQTSGKDSRGRAAYQLHDAAGSVFISVARPHEIFEITTAGHYLAGNFSAVDLVFDNSNAHVTVNAPSPVVTPDLTDMPPYFSIASVDFGTCNGGGCIVTAVVQGEAGSGADTVTLTLWGTRQLAACTATVVLAHYYDSKTVRCHAGSAAWTNWWYNSGGSYEVRGAIANPAYTS
jgi:hypothetical protein